MSELCMRRTEGPLEITGGPTILRKKNDCDLKIDKSQKQILQIYKTLGNNKLEQEKQNKKRFTEHRVNSAFYPYTLNANKNGANKMSK